MTGVKGESIEGSERMATSIFGRKRSTPISSLGPAGPVVGHVCKLLIKLYPSRAFYIIPETPNCLKPFCYLKSCITTPLLCALKSSGLISNQTCQAQATVTIELLSSHYFLPLPRPLLVQHHLPKILVIYQAAYRPRYPGASVTGVNFL